ncbi:MAG: hypothetical protein R3350_10330, partial [Saprospiraceae bacterium]|nr:hypothetical protein [Saprospiraceae bacterium]
EEYRQRFTREHEPFINDAFDKYYGIDRFGSFTDAGQFERFCQFLGLEFKTVSTHPHIRFDRLQALYLTKEYSFDPVMMADYYRKQAYDRENLCIQTRADVSEARIERSEWVVTYDRDGNRSAAMAPAVINATYAASNAINRIFELPEIELMHEISEIALLDLGKEVHFGLTVMDGPFCSIMPYGLSGLHSLSSVAYTHQRISYDALPSFSCQRDFPPCSPEATANCNFCPRKPATNVKKMLGQLSAYLKQEVVPGYYQSFFTIKSKLQSSFIDDGRPTRISILRENPHFYCIFAGKINSVYEIERVLDKDL